MTQNQTGKNRPLFSTNRLLLPLVILSVLVLSLVFIDVFAVYALRSNSDDLSIISDYLTWSNNRFSSELDRLTTANNQLSSVQTQLDSTQQQLASAQTEIKLYQNTYGEVESGDVHPTIGPDGQPITLVGNPAAADPTFAQLESFLLSDKKIKIRISRVSMSAPILPGMSTIMLEKPGSGRLSSVSNLRELRKAMH